MYDKGVVEELQGVGNLTGDIIIYAKRIWDTSHTKVPKEKAHLRHVE